MTQTIQLIVLVFLGALWGLSALARRNPQVRWLQPFNIKWPQLSEAQKDRMRRRSNILAGLKFVLLGFGVPVMYVASSVMMFNDPTTLGLTISGACGLALIVVGLVAIWQNRRSKLPGKGSDREQELYKRVTGRAWDPSQTD